MVLKFVTEIAHWLPKILVLCVYHSVCTLIHAMHWPNWLHWYSFKNDHQIRGLECSAGSSRIRYEHTRAFCPNRLNQGEQKDKMHVGSLRIYCMNCMEMKQEKCYNKTIIFNKSHRSIIHIDKQNGKKMKKDIQFEYLSPFPFNSSLLLIETNKQTPKKNK